MIKLFTAVPVPEALKEQIRAGLKMYPDEVRWIPEENWHITVHFIGFIDEAGLSSLQDALQQEVKKHRELTLLPESITPFPTARRPRMIWTTFERSEAFIRMATAIREALRPWSKEEESREPRPHITLSRIKRLKPSLKDMPVFEITHPHPVKITFIQLWKSTPLPAGQKYSNIFSADLQRLTEI